MHLCSSTGCSCVLAPRGALLAIYGVLAPRAPPLAIYSVLAPRGAPLAIYGVLASGAAPPIYGVLALRSGPARYLRCSSSLRVPRPRLGGQDPLVLDGPS